MQSTSLHGRVATLLFGLAMLLASGWAVADPPSRVGRLAYMTGSVSFSPAGEDEWLQASLNRPLTTGDRLWTDARSRAEVEVPGATLRLDGETSLGILNLDDGVMQLQLAQGTLHVRVRRLAAGQSFEVDTPNLAFTLRKPGDYRITVDPDGDATTVAVRSGQGEAYGQGAAYAVGARRAYRFRGTGLGEPLYVDISRSDEFDRWALERDRLYERSISARYVSPDVLGYHELDANGTWRVDATYGNVWFPSRVSSGWAPYRDGHWAWVDPWGWTWIDDAPWGFAVSHYGRWAHVRGNWGWVPGPVRTQAWYAPALVVFLGGDNFQLSLSTGNVGGVAWFPLGPREVYQPSYPVSRTYFDRINRSNTVVSTTVINNYYSTTNVTNIVHANRSVPGAIVAVPATAFVQSQNVSRAAVRVQHDAIRAQPVAAAPPVAPTERSVRGASAAGGKPPAKLFERAVVARTAPPEAHAGFAAQQALLAAKPGRPLDAEARKELRRAPTAPAPKVTVVPQAQRTAPKQAPPVAAQQAAPRPEREQRAPTARRAEAPAAPAARPEAGRATPTPVPPPAAAAQGPAEKPGAAQRREPRPEREQRAAPAQRTEPATAPREQRAAPAQRTEPATAPREQRAAPAQRTEPATPPRAVESRAEQPAVTERAKPPAAAARVPEPRREEPAPAARARTEPREQQPAAAARPAPEPKRPVAAAAPDGKPEPKAASRAERTRPAASRAEDRRQERDEKERK